MHGNPFSDAELAGRLARTRDAMAARRLDVAVFSVPESVFYLTGLDHWGYFAPHHLIVGQDGPPRLITRAMERVTIANQLREVVFEGHSDADGDSAADRLRDRLTALRPRGSAVGGWRIGLEMHGAGLSAAAHGRLQAAFGEAALCDISGLSPCLRRVKSAEEIALMRRAARVSDAGTEAAIAALHDGAPEPEVAAQVLAAMTRAGGAPPGFGPFLRPEARLGEEHATWGDGQHRRGGRAFLELAGCVGRYHAPMGRLIHVGPVPEADARVAEICAAAFDAVCAALRPGRRARDVYAAWQAVVDDAGLAHYRRHHCGYVVGIGVPPSWTGGNAVAGLRHDSDMALEAGMSFHILSWLMGTGRGDFFRSDCVLLGPRDAEVLTRAPAGPVAV